VPKMKTHKGTAKRIRLTGTGKVMMRKFNPKRAKRARTSLYDNRRDVAAHGTVVKQIRQNLPYAKRSIAPSNQSSQPSENQD
jgi:ribosomal protein L35